MAERPCHSWPRPLTGLNLAQAAQLSTSPSPVGAALVPASSTRPSRLPRNVNSSTAISSAGSSAGRSASGASRPARRREWVVKRRAVRRAWPGRAVRRSPSSSSAFTFADQPSASAPARATRPGSGAGRKAERAELELERDRLRRGLGVALPIRERQPRLDVEGSKRAIDQHPWPPGSRIGWSRSGVTTPRCVARPWRRPDAAAPLRRARAPSGDRAERTQSPLPGPSSATATSHCCGPAS